MKRSLVVTSIGLHVAAFGALTLAGFWSLDRLEAARRPVDIAVADPPPAAAAAGSLAGAKADVKNKQRHITKDLVVPERREDKKEAAEVPGIGAGSGTGTGSGSGAGSGSGTDPTGTGTCAVPPCGEGSGKAPPPPPKQTPVMVPPTVIRGLRTSGETQIHPPDTVKTQMMRDGASKVMALLRLCVGPGGEVGDVSVLKSSGYAGYDDALVSGLERWRYRAYQVNGRAVPVCGVVTFIYTIQ